MTTGPGAEDQDRGRLLGTRSVNGPRLARRGRHDEPVEDGERVERAGRALGVVLDRLDRQLAVAQPLDGAVVEVDLADPEADAAGQRLADDLDLVVLGRHLDQPQLEVLDRVVGAVVPEPQPRRVRARGAADDLVAEADPEQRPAVVDDGARQRDLGRRGGPDRRARATGSRRRCRRRGRRRARRVCGRTRTRAPRRRIDRDDVRS